MKRQIENQNLKKKPQFNPLVRIWIGTGTELPKDNYQFSDTFTRPRDQFESQIESDTLYKIDPSEPSNTF